MGLGFVLRFRFVKHAQQQIDQQWQPTVSINCTQVFSVLAVCLGLVVVLGMCIWVLAWVWGMVCIGIRLSFVCETAINWWRECVHNTCTQPTYPDRSPIKSITFGCVEDFFDACNGVV